MKVGDLVRYVSMYEQETGAAWLPKNEDCGLIVAIGGDGYYSVIWLDGMHQEDLVHSELEVINESR